MNKLTYSKITFSKAARMSKKTNAIVLRGAGHVDHRDDWVNGINNELLKNKIFKAPTTEHYTLNVNEDRDDIIMVFGEKQKPNMGKMAMWRLGWLHDISWLEDYIVNDSPGKVRPKEVTNGN